MPADTIKVTGFKMPLRPLAEKDLPLIRAWTNAPEVRRNMYSKHEITEAAHQSWFARLKDDDQSRWFIHENVAGQPDGVVYFTQLQPANGSAFWGFCAAPGALPGSGTRLGLDALDKAFSDLGLHKLNAEVFTSNEASLRFQNKLGFKEEGLFRDFHFDGESYIDVVRLGILAKEWSAKREEIQTRIAKVNALSVAKIAGDGGYKIMILSDRHSWIAPYLDELAEEWAAAGHDCQIAHKVSDVEPADFCFCLSFSQILPAIARTQFKNTLVVHESDLPKGKGWSPLTWQILEGKNRIPATLFEATEKVDSGVIYAQDWMEFEGHELIDELREVQAKITIKLCKRYVDGYPQILAEAREQAGKESFYPRRRASDSQIDTQQSIESQFDLLRVIDNQRYPAFFENRHHRYFFKIEKVENL